MIHLPFETRTRAPLAWRSRPGAYLVIIGFAAILAGAAAAINLEPAARAALGVVTVFLVAAVALAGLAAWRRDRRLIREATEIASRFARGERTLRIPSHSGLDTHSRFVEAFNRAADSLAARESEFRLFARATGDAVWDWNIAKDEVVWIHGGRSVLGADVAGKVMSRSGKP